MVWSADAHISAGMAAEFAILLNTSIIRNAIASKEVLEFKFKGYIRIAEPHVYGLKNEKRMLLVYQIGGAASSGSIPSWRLMPLEDIVGLKATGQKFEGARELPPEYSQWDSIIAQVK